MLKQSLIDSWLFFKNHAVAISIIILPVVIPVEIFSALYQIFIAGDDFVLSEQLILIFIDFVAYPIYAVAVIFYIASAISGARVDVTALWKQGLKYWVPYFFLTVIVSIAVIFGLMLLLVPGIILAVRYSFSEFDLLLNKSSPLEAMKNSWNASKDYMWVILGGFAVITLALYVPYYLASSLFDDASVSSKVFAAVLNMLYAVLNVMYTIFAFRVYELAKVQASPLP